MVITADGNTRDYVITHGALSGNIVGLALFISILAQQPYALPLSLLIRVHVDDICARAPDLCATDVYCEFPVYARPSR